ncbi:hypothetical protein FOQG_01496 [Fusarium oxysporum f. sp. raphani 54005]|uniref:Uncharacterized protein n=8 Tax=Fusarium oxysporum TaxID=5507 RepID=W9I624_FUSOX|nr:hypothetical protein FOXG_18531 [Fusarium oxysporum f. sp. lycopersici 4287]EWY88750.1 hypothetical protein FOYG_09808 [Fusarium oxysporum NRRL 32931]EWZ39737.1 hypothetical protein FOZG_08739 [Fusarium oxysporum Fo47]EWZ88168.1 hypothetical protein FOWG_09722 [Fusarium oxysporum f. sp. lycopersici MN25]EXA40536.1 hypothetical protein FOVG_09342 [Fusarium oxysporum f. sp. pisi HDV247]EXK30880.1 hypothetical protein FOMG_12728 [Fusarium oxysporum f. sp. melonis 26406]EXK98653.1 hypothetical
MAEDIEHFELDFMEYLFVQVKWSEDSHVFITRCR